MTLNPNGAPAGYYYEAGATAYLIDPAGTYSLAGARAPTTDPAGTYSAAGASAPTTDPAGTYSAAGARSPKTDPAGTYSGPGASAPTTDPAGTHSAARASAPKTDRAGTYSGPGASAATTDPAGTYSAAGASAPTTDPAGTYSAARASAPRLAAAGTYIPVTGSTSAVAQMQDPAGTYSPAGASAPTTDPAGTYSAAGASAPTTDPAGTYTTAGASAPTQDPPGTFSGAGAPAPTPADPGTYIAAAGATSAAAEIADPAGTYSAAGASAPIADPGGAYSAAGASAPTTDPAGTYSSPYALNRLFIEGGPNTPGNVVLSFNSATAVANYYGATSPEAYLANEFFAGYGGTSATMLFTRFSPLGGERSHLLGANISNLTPSQLQSINGSLSITLQGTTYSGSINLSGVHTLTAAATAIRSALNSNLPVEAVTAGSSITPVAISFSGSLNGYYLQVTSVSSGSIELGAQISGPGIAAGSFIINQLDGTPGDAGLYSLFIVGGTTSSETMTESYGVLTVGSVTSGAVAVGEEVAGAGVLPLTAIDDNLSGSGPGSTWLVNNAQTVAGENMTMNATPLTVTLESDVGATENNDYFKISTKGDFLHDHNPSTLSFMTGTAAAALGLTQASGAIDSTPGGELPLPSAFMNNLVQNENGQFGSFQSYSVLNQGGPDIQGGMAAWAQSTDGLYTFSSQTTTTSPAGSSAPTTDPAGTYSLAGASAPTLADPGTYIPVTGATSAAAEIVDPAGTYSLAGASAPTLAQPGYYVPTAGASSETQDDPGYYSPYSGATAEILALPPIISGTIAGQSTASGQPDTPFSSATIADPNIDTSDSLSIQVTGGGGALSDGAGFDGLTTSAGVYILSGTAAAITTELEALVFAPNTFAATTTFTLVDTTSLGTSATDANTTVTVTNGESVVVSVSTFLADKSTLDKMPGGFDILDLAAAITIDLDHLSDPNIDAITDNAEVGPDVQQLTTDATAIGKLQNANLSPALLAISDTAADVEAGLSTLVADTGEIASITASNGPIVVLAAAFLSEQSALDKIVGGFDVSDQAANVEANLDQLNDPNISAITVSDNGQISASVAQLTADVTAIGKLRNANASPVLLAINDTAGAVQTGLSTLVANTGEIGSITTSYGPIFVSAATYLADQSTLDKIVGGFDVSDSAPNLVADLSILNADFGVAAITADIGEATLNGGAGVNAPNFLESGWGTSLTVSEALAYAGAFSQGSGSTTAITTGDSLSLTGNAGLSGTTSGAGTLALAGGSATIDSGAELSVSQWSISGGGTDVTLGGDLDYSGSFSESASDTFVLSGGYLLLNGANDSFAGATVDGSNFLYTEGTAAVSGLTIGGTVEWENTNTVNQSGGNVTLGDNIPADAATLFNTSAATYDILDNSGIGLGASAASDINNVGLLEKTGGTATSVVAPAVTNTGTIEVAAGTLDMQGAVTGTGSDEISGASTLEFDATVSAGQTVSFTGSGGDLALHNPGVFAGDIGGFDAAGAGSNDIIEVAQAWVFTGFTENAGGTEGTLGFASGSSATSLTLLGDYNPAGFVHQTKTNGSTLITYI
jgi:hypothetical protein